MFLVFWGLERFREKKIVWIEVLRVRFRGFRVYWGIWAIGMSLKDLKCSSLLFFLMT